MLKEAKKYILEFLGCSALKEVRLKNGKWSFSLKFLVIVVPILVAGLCVFIVREVAFVQAVESLQTGMSRKEVKIALGSPNRVVDGGDWEYTAYWGQGWVTVRFDDSYKVYNVAIEKPYP